MKARLSGITGRQSRAFSRPNITNASYVRACHDLFSSGLAPSQIFGAQGRRQALYKYARDGIPLLRPIEARPVRVGSVALFTFVPSVPLPGSGNKLPNRGHQYGFLAERLSVERQAKRLKVLCLVNQD